MQSRSHGAVPFATAARYRTAMDDFAPRFDAAGLLTAVVTDRASGALLMVAHMNAQALDHTRRTRTAWFWSRSRQALWNKGETSGNVLAVRAIRVDCDQDCIQLICDPAGPACHTGAASCFYRTLGSDGHLHSDS
jgi:phosphoribosyl-AMP cyclohydrolase